MVDGIINGRLMAWLLGDWKDDVTAEISLYSSK